MKRVMCSLYLYKFVYEFLQIDTVRLDYGLMIMILNLDLIGLVRFFWGVIIEIV